MARGYINDAELTALKFVQNPFTNSSSSLLYKTGDLGRFLPKDRLEYRGRVDNHVKVRGIRIELGDIVTALRQNPIVSEAVVITKDFGDNDQRLVACVVFATVLKLESVGIFFDVSILDFLAGPTVAQIAAVVDAAGAEGISE